MADASLPQQENMISFWPAHPFFHAGPEVTILYIPFCYLFHLLPRLEQRVPDITSWVMASTPASSPTSFEEDMSSEAATEENVIEIRNLSKIYRDFWGRKKVQALNSLTLDVRPGEVFGLLGPNGSGKTTTLKLLLGLLFPSGGEVRVLGQPAHDVNKNERIGYLPEESYLYRFLNADETLDFYGRLFDMKPAERKRRADELIERVGLQGARKRQLKEYSKGMTRRIGLAQALINDPDLVLLDEPTSGLDPLGTADMKQMILDLKKSGKTVVMCSHLLADVQDVCDRIAILYAGELKVLGRVQDLLQSTDETQLLTSSLDDEVVDQIRQVLEQHGAELKEVTHPTATLEQLFLSTVAESRERPGHRFVAEESPKTPPQKDANASDA